VRKVEGAAVDAVASGRLLPDEQARTKLDLG
jgi:hypothetical protein